MFFRKIVFKMGIAWGECCFPELKFEIMDDKFGLFMIDEHAYNGSHLENLIIDDGKWT